ncbi:MAG TPA: DUF5060 domain-containing protein, partial [Limnochordia bacterium]|nr:DUF5060 domain-containing protein [Limnochordia bacterium]
MKLRLPYFYEGAVECNQAIENPLHDVSVWAMLTSPSGQTHRALAFWDGGRVWRFRFSADEPGE